MKKNTKQYRIVYAKNGKPKIRSRKVLGTYRSMAKRIPGPILGLDTCSWVILRTVICFFVRFHDILPNKNREKTSKTPMFCLFLKRCENEKMK